LSRAPRASYHHTVRTRAFIGFAIVLATPTVSRVAAADAPHAIAVASAAGACPSATDVTAALIAIFPDLRVAAPDDATALHVDLSATDHGIHVRAGSAERDFTGDDCAERARKAAVFAALVVAPPTVDVPAEPIAEPARVTRSVDIAPPRRAARDWPWLQLDLAAALETAPDINNLYSTGGELGVFVGGEHVGAVASVAALASSDLQAGSTVASLTRMPAAFGVRVRRRDGQIGVAADAAVTTSLLIVRGLGTYGEQSDRFEVGGRLAARVEYWAWPRIAVFAAAQLDIVPDTYNLAAPSGMAASTPGWWVGGVIGATAGFP
jgi:hypothetical protein